MTIEVMLMQYISLVSVVFLKDGQFLKHMVLVLCVPGFPLPRKEKCLHETLTTVGLQLYYECQHKHVQLCGLYLEGFVEINRVVRDCHGLSQSRRLLQHNLGHPIKSQRLDPLESQSQQS